jgi:hypothetical protein
MTAPGQPQNAAEDEPNLNPTASPPRRHRWPKLPTRISSELTIRTCERCGLVWHSRHDWTTSNGPSHWSEFYAEANPEMKMSKRPECAP